MSYTDMVYARQVVASAALYQKFISVEFSNAYLYITLKNLDF